MYRKLLLVTAGVAGMMLAEPVFVDTEAFAAIGGGGTCPGIACSSTGNVTFGATTITVGGSSTGTLTITGVVTTSKLIAGSTQFATGNVYVNLGGQLTDDAIIGDAGTGMMSNTGTHTVSGNLILGNQSTGNGTYSITGDTAQTNVNFNPGGNGAANPPGSNGWVTDSMGNPISPIAAPNGALIVGQYGTGQFTQGNGADTGNQVNVAGDLVVGNQSGSLGTYTLNSGTLTVGGIVAVGGDSTGNNQLIQNGGSIVLTGNANGNSDYVGVSAGCSSPSGSCTYPGTFYVGGQSASDYGTGTYVLNAGTLNTPTLAVGYGGTGTVTQSGGTVTANFVDMGDCGGCNGGNSAGFYNLNGTGQLTTQNLNVGDFGHGEFTQGADGNGNTTNTVTGTLSIGNGPTAIPNVANPGNWDRSGTYTLDSGTLSTQYTVVGSTGTGTFNQNGGSHEVANTLTIGQQSTTCSISATPCAPTLSDPQVFGGPAIGVYNMTAGTLTAGGDATTHIGIVAGDGGNGTFNQTGGSVTSGVLDTGSGGQRGDLVIGAQSGSQGSYNLGDSTNGAPTLQVYGDTIIGRDAGSNAGTVPGATPTSPNLVIAGNGTAMSVNQYTGFDANNGGNMLVGLGGNGAVTQTDQSTLYLDHDLVLGANSGSNGSYTLGATSITDGSNFGYNLFVGSDLNVGGFNPATDIYGYNPQTTTTGGTGTFTQTSGDAYVVGAANIGNTGGNGTYMLSNGTLTVAGALNIGTTANPGDGTSGTFTQSGGSTTVQGNGVFIGEGGAGQYTLSGGTLSVVTGANKNPTTMIVGDASQGTFTQTGGTVIAGVAASGGSYNDPVNDVFNLTIGNQANTAGPGGTSAPSLYSISSSDQSNPASLQVNGNINLGVNPGALGNMTIGTSGLATDATSVTASLDSLSNNNGGNILVGVNGASSSQSSTLTQYSGSVTAANDVAIGINPSPGIGGTYIQSGGTLTTPTLEVGGSEIFSTPGNGGSGIYTQEGGLVTVGGGFGGQILANGSVVPGTAGGPGVLGTLTIGAQGGNGLYELGTGAGGQSNIAVWGGYPDTPGTPPPAFDSVNNAPYLQVYGNVSIAPDTNSGGTFLLAGDGSTLNINTVVGYPNQGSMVVGGSGSATFSQTDKTTVNLDGSLAIGVNQGSNSSYTLSAGTNGAGSLTVGGDLEIGGTDHVGGPIAQTNGGYGGQGTFNQSAGSVTVQGNMNLGTNGDGTNDANGNGAYNLSGGTLTVNNVGRFGNNGGTGTFTQTGGTAQFGTASNSGGLQLGTTPLNGPLSTGSYAITGSGSALNVYGNADIGVAANTTGSMTIGGGSDNPTVSIIQTSTLAGDGNLTIGDAGTGTLTVNSGTLGVANTMQIGVNGTGTVTQSGGDVTAGFVDLSVPSGTGSSSYAISGGSLTTTADLNVGGQGTGTATFTQSAAGAVSVDGTLRVANVGGNAAYTLGGSGSLSIGGDMVIGNNNGTGGTFNYNTTSGDAATLSFTGSGQNLVVGDSGNGIFYEGSATNTTDLNLQTGGTTLDIGRSFGGNGTFNLAAGSSLEDDMIVGDAGTGTMNNAGGTHTVGTTSSPANLILGNQSTGNGTYNLTLGGTTTVSGFTFVGAAGQGTFLNDASTLNANGPLVLAEQADSTGMFTLQNGGAVNVGVAGAPAFMDVAESGTATYTQTSGTTTIIGALDVGRCGAAATATCNNGTNPYTGAAGNGTLNLSGGSMSVILDTATDSGGFAKVGDAGTGAFNISGGASFTANNLDLALDGGTGTVTMDGSATTMTLGGLGVGDNGKGTFTQNAGAVQVNGGLFIGKNASSSDGFATLPAGNGEYDLNGGTLTVTGDATIGDNGYGKLTEDAGTADIKGSMTIANSAAGGAAEIEGGSLTVGDGGTGNQLLITSNGSMNIEDTGGVGAVVTVDGVLVNNGKLYLGLDDITPGSNATTLTAKGGFQNNNSFNFEANSVLDANVTNGNSTNSSASFSTQNGASANVTLNGNMDNYATVNVSSLGGTGSSVTQTGNFTNESTGTFQVVGSNVTINGSGTALDNYGKVTFSEDLNGPTAPISTVGITGNVTNESTGTMTFTDAAVTVTGDVDNHYQIIVQRDPSSVNVASNVTVTGTLTNELGATLSVNSSAITVNGNTTNNGTISVSNATAHWNGTFTNNGGYTSDPSTTYFQNLTIGTTGYMTGGTGDLFDVTGNLHNASTQNTVWNTTGAELEFSTGTSTTHTMDVAGLDLGATSSGFSDNFAWGVLDLDAGNTLDLEGTIGINALYAADLMGLDISGDDILNILGDGLNIYYDPSIDTALGDLTYGLANGGVLCPINSTCSMSVTPPPPSVPEPASLLLLGGGLAGLGFVRRRAARSRRQMSVH